MGYFDLQVNGYSGVDFNGDSLDATAVETMCKRLQAQSVDGILVTIITDLIPVMEGRLQGLVQLLDEKPSLRQTIRGIHIEGPFINPEVGYRGLHPTDAIVPADLSAMQRLLDAAGGFARLVTLAPEFDNGLKVTRSLADANIVVSAGHTNASLNCLQQAIDAGLSMFTHVGNGCPPVLPRHDNIVQRVLSLRERLWLCFIADGAHVPFFALKNYLDAIGLDRTIVVTDAIVAADMGPGKYTFGRWDMVIGEDLVARSPDNYHLLGATISMEGSFRNLTEQLGLTSADALMLLDSNPKRAIPGSCSEYR